MVIKSTNMRNKRSNKDFWFKIDKLSNIYYSWSHKNKRTWNLSRR